MTVSAGRTQPHPVGAEPVGATSAQAAHITAPLRQGHDGVDPPAAANPNSAASDAPHATTARQRPSIPAGFYPELASWAARDAAGPRDRAAAHRMARCLERGERKLDLELLQQHSLPDPLRHLTHLEHLDLGGNELQSLPDWAGGLTRLTALELDGNQLRELPPAIPALRSLAELNLARNPLSHLPESVGQLSALRTLDLRGSRVRCLPDSLDGLPVVREGIQAAGTPLGRRPRGHWLVSPDTSRFIQQLDEWACDARFPDRRLAQSLIESCQRDADTELHLSHLKLGSLPECIENLRQLAQLSARDCALTEVPETLGQLRALRTLDLADNALEALPSSIGQLRELRTLDLERNRLAGWDLRDAVRSNSMIPIPTSRPLIRTLARQLRDSNRMIPLPNSLGALENLECLKLAGNFLLVLPTSMRALPRLNWSQDMVADSALAGLELADWFRTPASRDFRLRLEHWANTGADSENRALARDRILECHDRAWTDLDLRDLGLADLDFGLGGVSTNLLELNLADNPLRHEALSDLRGRFLRRLDISGTDIDRLPESLESRTMRITATDTPLATRDRSQWFRPPPLHDRLASTTALGRALSNWHSDGRAYLRAFWHEDRSASAQNFVTFLDRLSSTADYARAPTRVAFRERVSALLDAMDTDRILRQRVYRIAREATESCSDRISLGLNDMLIEVENRRAERGLLSLDELLALGRGRFRLAQLRQAASLLIEHAPDPLETWLKIQLALRERLALPVTTEHMAYGASVSPTNLDRLTQRVLAAETRPSALRTLLQLSGVIDTMTEPDFIAIAAIEKNPLAEFLAREYSPWATAIARQDPQAHRAMQDLAQQYLSKADDAAQAGTLSSAAYQTLAREAQFIHNHGRAYHMALEMLDREMDRHAQGIQT